MCTEQLSLVGAWQNTHLQFAACKNKKVFAISKALDHVFTEDEAEDTKQHSNMDDPHRRRTV